MKYKTGPCKGWPNSHTNEERSKSSSAQFHTGGRDDSIGYNRNKIEDCIIFSLLTTVPHRKEGYRIRSMM